MASEVDCKAAEGLGPEACDQWQNKRPWAQARTDGFPWAEAASLVQCEGGQGVEEVVESPCWEILKTRLAVVPDNLFLLALSEERG